MSHFTATPQEKAELLTPRQRTISAAELCLAIFIVVAHNVYHWIPNEVPILFLLALVSFRLREKSWGLRLYARPVSWMRTLSLAALCLILLELKDLAIEALGHRFSAAPEQVSSVLSGAHSLRTVLFSILFVWVFAAFGEEIGYRGYMLRKALEAFGPGNWSVALALLITSAAFGLGHYYKGPAGMLDSAGSGLILGGAYLASSRLWASILTHGVNDTFAVILAYFGH